MKNNKTLLKVAICYDFDGTLAPGNMQEYGFMKALKTTPASFWKKSDELAAKHLADKNLCYMQTMLSEAAARNIAYRKEDYQFKVLVKDRNKAEKQYANAIVGPATIEEIMLFYVKGEMQ